MIKIIHAYVVLSAFTVSSLFGQEFNRPVPDGFPKYEYRQFAQSATASNYLMTPIYPTVNSPMRYASIMDNDGYLKWFAGDGQEILVNLEFHPDHNRFSFAALNDFTTYIWKYYVTDMGLNIIDSLVPTGDPITDIHEFRILENGNYLLVGAVNTDEDLIGYTFNGLPGGNPISVRSFTIQEFDNGNLVFDWKSVDYIHPEEFVDGYNYFVSDFDYAHGNSVEEDSDGNFLVSFRHLDAIYKIDRVTGQVIWILGGESNQFDFVNDLGFSGQHDARVLENGNITLFDNGNRNVVPRASRGVEYELDLAEMTATRVWQYHEPYYSYASAQGSVRVGADLERVVGFGYCFRPTANFIHLDDQGEVISELLFQDSVTSYRTTREVFELDFIQPEITCLQEEFEVTLAASPGYDHYLWSTGDTTQEIHVVDTGSYQVWTNIGGKGMVGSQPFFLTDLSDPCVVGTREFAKVNHEIEFIRPTPDNGIYEVLLNGRVNIYNAIGQVMLAKDVRRSSLINISDQPKGVYVLVFENEQVSRSVNRILKF